MMDRDASRIVATSAVWVLLFVCIGVVRACNYRTFPTAPHVISTTADSAASVYAADIDGDGDLDVLSASSLDGKIAWYENMDGAGTFTPLVASEHVITTMAEYAQSVYAADVDGDGDLDVLSASEWDDKIAWYENMDGNGTFTPLVASEHVITTTADGAQSVYAADVDGDGDLDVLSASANDHTIAWYENMDGNGTFTPLVESEHVITTTANVAQSVYAADVDGDGDLDVLSASYNDDTIAWYENMDGAGTFTPLVESEHVITTTANGARSVYAADVDGDGDLDVLSASYFDDKIAWYENMDGEGTFTPLVESEHVITTTADLALSVYAADVDGDGDLDVLSASANDDKIAWYENMDGNGTFTPLVESEHVITTTADVAVWVYAADVDGDGDLDVLSASQADDTIAWYENTACADAPTDAPTPQPTQQSTTTTSFQTSQAPTTTTSLGATTTATATDDTTGTAAATSAASSSSPSLASTTIDVYFGATSSAPTTDSSTTALVLGVASVFVLALACGLVALFLFCGGKRRRRNNVLSPPPSPRAEEQDGFDGATGASGIAMTRTATVDMKVVLAAGDVKKSKRIGEGAYGYVYEAKWRSVNCAVKEVKVAGDSSAASEQMLLEAQQLQALRSHKNVVALYGVILEPLSIVLEYCSHGSLDEHLYGKRPTAFTDAQLLSISVGAARGVLHLHEEGIVHRDLAARNVLLDGSDFTAKITDFGMARDIGDKRKSALNTTKTVVGPLKWMAPEQLSAQVVSTQSDVYSFGVVLYEVYAATEPWPSLQPVAAAHAVMNGETMDVPQRAPPNVANAMRRCWLFVAADRPAMASVVAMLDESDEAADGDDGATHYESPPPPAGTYTSMQHGAYARPQNTASNATYNLPPSQVSSAASIVGAETSSSVPGYAPPPSTTTGTETVVFAYGTTSLIDAQQSRTAPATATATADESSAVSGPYQNAPAPAARQHRPGRSGAARSPRGVRSPRSPRKRHRV